MVAFSDQKCTGMVTRAGPSTVHPSECCVKNPNHMLPSRKNSLSHSACQWPLWCHN